MKNLALILMLIGLAACSKKNNSDGCRDRSLMDDNIKCSLVYDPVCGCDGQTYGNECEAKYQNGVQEYTKGACGCDYKVKGIVLKSSQGFRPECPLLILTSTGKYLEPVKLPEGVTLRENTQVEFNYRTITTHKSLCVADGDLAEIVCYREVATSGCQQQAKLNVQGFTDRVFINSSQILGNCLEINFNYGGGCNDHDFELSILPAFGAPSTSVLYLELVHQANGDQCQALIYKTLSFDLSNLKDPYLSEKDFYLLDSNPNNHGILHTYRY